jgi:hypothetical protein
LVIGIYRRGRLLFYTKIDKYLTIIYSFILTQTIEQKPVMVAIQTFLNNLEPSSYTKVKLIVQENNIYIPKAKPTIRVYVTDYSFI